jgi:hypothetical protein
MDASGPPPLRRGTAPTALNQPRAHIAPSFDRARERLRAALDELAFFKVLSVSQTSAPGSAPGSGLGSAPGSAPGFAPGSGPGSVSGLGSGGAAVVRMSFTGTAVEALPSFRQDTRTARRVLVLKRDRGVGVGNFLGGAVRLADAPRGPHDATSIPSAGDILVGTPEATLRRDGPRDGPRNGPRDGPRDGSRESTALLLKTWHGGAKPLQELARVVRYGTQLTAAQLRDVLRQPGAAAAERFLAACADDPVRATGTAGLYERRTREDALSMTRAADDIWMVARVVLYGNVRALAYLHVCQIGRGECLSPKQRLEAEGLRLSLPARAFINVLTERLDSPDIATAFSDAVHLLVPDGLKPAASPPSLPSQPSLAFHTSKDQLVAAFLSSNCASAPVSPSYTPASPSYTPASPVYAPSSPVYAPSSPVYAPSSPVYAPSSPPFAPSSPPCAPSSPPCAPSSPPFAPSSPPCAPSLPPYAPSSPPYAPSSPPYAPSSPPCAPSSPPCAPSSPLFAPSSPPAEFKTVSLQPLQFVPASAPASVLTSVPASAPASAPASVPASAQPPLAPAPLFAERPQTRAKARPRTSKRLRAELGAELGAEL